MTPLEKFRQQVAIAKASAAGDLKSYVVQTADEAQALLDEIDGPHGTVYLSEDACNKLKAAGVLPSGAVNVKQLCKATFEASPETRAKYGDGLLGALNRGPIDPPGDDEVV